MTNNQQNETIELLTKLVSIPSPSTQEVKASTYLAGWMNAHRLQASIDAAGNAVGVKGNGLQEILLLGHIDTFPGQVPVRQEGDLLYGRGSVDAKGPLCTFAAATAQVDVPDGLRITVVGAVEEESASSKGALHILHQRLPGGAGAQGSKGAGQQDGSNRPPVYCIIGEPSNWDRITLGYKGRLLMFINLTVPFSHSAGEGRLPAEQAVDLWRQIEDYCTVLNQEREAKSPFTKLDPSLRHIASQDAGMYGTVDMSLGFRLPVDIIPAKLEQELRALVETLAPETKANVHFRGHELAYKGNKSNALVRAFLPAIRGAGGKPRFVVKTGTADMNVVAPHWPDTPIIAYGPGDSSLDHTPNEHINLKEYLQAIEVLTATLQNLMSTS